MAGVSANCTTLTIAGVDFASVSNIQTGKLIVTKGCCAGAGDPVEFNIFPVDGSEDLTVTDGEVTIHAGDLGTGVEGDTIADGIYTVTAEWVTNDGSGDVTSQNKTCLFVDCSIRCQVAQLVKSAYIDETEELSKAEEAHRLFTAIKEGLIACEYCDTACLTYSQLYELLNNTDCQCQ